MDLGFADGLISKWTDRPFNVEFAITRACSSRCLMCRQWQMRPQNELTQNEITRIFQSYPHFKIIGITGGEPSLRPDLAPAVNAIIDVQPDLKRLFITTNGFRPAKIRTDMLQILRHTAEIYDCEGKSPAITILVSIDGPEPLHNHIRGRKFAYKRAVETLKRMADLQDQFSFFRVGSVSTYGPWNYREYDAVLEELRSLRGLYDLEPAFCFVWHGNLYNTLDPATVDLGYLKAIVQDRQKIMKFLKETKSGLLDARSLFWRFSPFFAENTRRQVIPCEGARVRYYVDSHGVVFPCIIWDFAVGDLRAVDYDFRQIFKDVHGVRKIARQIIKDHGCPICYLTCEFIPTMMSHPGHVAYKYLQDLVFKR